MSRQKWIAFNSYKLSPSLSRGTNNSRENLPELQRNEQRKGGKMCTRAAQRPCIDSGARCEKCKKVINLISSALSDCICIQREENCFWAWRIDQPRVSAYNQPRPLSSHLYEEENRVSYTLIRRCTWKDCLYAAQCLLDCHITFTNASVVVVVIAIGIKSL